MADFNLAVGDMVARRKWTRQQLLVAFGLYCRLPFGRLHSRNPEIVRFAEAIGRTPSALAMKLTNIASLDPAITSTGRTGLMGASANDRAMWEEMHSDWERFAVESQQAIETVRAREEPTDEIPQDTDEYPIGEDRAVQTTVRVGQNFFRSAVMSAYGGRCCITALSVPSLLVASHIVPWRHDKSNRLNPRNGLLLSALHDKAFDSGLLTINDDMTVLVSQDNLVLEDDYFQKSILNYQGQQIELPEKFAPDPAFLSYHRERVFQG